MTRARFTWGGLFGAMAVGAGVCAVVYVLEGALAPARPKGGGLRVVDGEGRELGRLVVRAEVPGATQPAAEA